MHYLSKRLLDKYTQQFLPDVPELDYSKIDVSTAIKTIKDFTQLKVHHLVLHISSNYYMVRMSQLHIQKIRLSNHLMQHGLLILF